MIALIYDPEKMTVLVEKERPTCSSNTAVMKVLAAAVCGTDLRTYRFGSDKITPGMTIGHEGVGEIVEIGPEVKGFTVGDRVQIAPAIDPVDDYARRIGRPNLSANLKTLGFQFDGMFADYMEIPAEAFEAGNITRIEGDVDSEVAALAEPIACALNGQEFLHVSKGDRVAIFGSGFIGCMHAELVMMNGAQAVYMIEPNVQRLESAVAKNPKIVPINPTEVNPVERVKELTNQEGAEVAIVACSVGEAQRQALDICAVYGRVSLFGGLPGESTGFVDSNVIHYKELSVHGVHASTPTQNRTVLQWIIEGKLDARKYLSEVRPLAEIQDVFAELDAGDVTKVVVVPDGLRAGGE